MKNTHLEEVAMKKQNTLVRMMSVMMLLAITGFASSGLVRAQYEAQLGADNDGVAVWVQLGEDIDGEPFRTFRQFECGRQHCGHWGYLERRHRQSRRACAGLPIRKRDVGAAGCRH